MRKCVLFVIAVTMILGSGVANAAQWDGIVRIGWSNAKFLGGSRLGSDFHQGGTISAATELRLNRDFGWEFGIALTQKGGQGTVTNMIAQGPSNPPPSTPQYTADAIVDLDYLEFQIVPVIHIDLSESWETKIYVGAAWAQLLRARVEGTVTTLEPPQTTPVSTPIDVDIEDQLSSVDFVGIIGAGLAVDWKKVAFVVDVRLEFGLRDIDELDNEGDGIRTYAGLFTLGIEFPIAY
ncbi:MAG: hypothetical protein O7D32_05420 [bacterium]|nr:hypothetical protein [bacterium]